MMEVVEALDRLTHALNAKRNMASRLPSLVHLANPHPLTAALPPSVIGVVY